MSYKSSVKTVLIGSFSWIRLLRSTIIIYAMTSIVLYFIADGMIFLPPAASYRDGPDILKIPVTDGQAISAYYLTRPENRLSLIFIHGNAEDIGHIRPLMLELSVLGFNVFAYDYRGYGTSDGKPSEKNAYQDVQTAYRYLTETLDVQPDHIIVYGRSVGTGSAVHLASHHVVGGVILEAPFMSAFRVVLPFPLFPFDKFPNLKNISNVICPVLIMHGQQDKVIPFHHGKKLFDAVAGPKFSLWIESAGHNDFALAAGDRYYQTLTAFRDYVLMNHEPVTPPQTEFPAGSF